MDLPRDSYMLLSVINMKLRDGALSLEEICAEYDVSRAEIEEKLRAIGYVYAENRRTFVPA